ncbi:2-hydroxyacid dehydrogenase [Bordetella genomosp. 13]|uniref:2-hydroxyacid dehydrogenase n=1 Tax=Bordetella genomosp. 13 TaxID=463040 RepID=UPI00119F21E2|nr:2-hydroxyacid dehydrogenase [Bordetella genomosp. 13]
MRIEIVGLHAGHAPRLQQLLGNDYQVEGRAAFAATGDIGADVVIANSIAPRDARRIRGRLVQVPGAGVDQVAVADLPSSSWVCNVHGHEVPIAEFVIHAILEHALTPWAYPAVLDEDAWPRAYARRAMHGEAAGRTVVIVGYGHIGQEVARRARALDMNVVALTRGGQGDPAHGVRHRPVAALHDVLPSADVLVLCCPLNDATRGLIGHEALARMPPDALLVNVARAEVVDEQALYDALRERRLGRAALDVWYRYPAPGGAPTAPASLPLHSLPNVRGTPHISAMTPGLLDRRYRFMAENIRRLQSGEPLENVVRAGH